MPRVHTILIIALLFLAILRNGAAQENSTARQTDVSRAPSPAPRADDTPINVLSSDEWRNMDRAVERGLTYLAAQQQADGSFPTDPIAQPGVTSLCLLAFMAHGHNPGKGPHGDQLDRAVRYIVECQKQNGLIMLLGSDEPQIN